MKPSEITVSNHRELCDLCVKVAEDRLLVQGAGGNASVKNENVLRVKASGKWLSDALNDDIFVDVDLQALKMTLDENLIPRHPRLLGLSSNKPSIETILHAIMPHKFVLHLHMVDALALLVNRQAETLIHKFLGNQHDYVYLKYLMPGEPLARELLNLSRIRQLPRLVFLQNHGIVIGGDSTDDILDLLNCLQLKLKQNVYEADFKIFDAYDFGLYKTSHELWSNNLSTSPHLLNFVKNCWALYPDHVVFLGNKPKVLKNVTKKHLQSLKHVPFVFSETHGTLVSKNVTDLQIAQLKCYHDVLVRIEPGSELNNLSDEDSLKLLDWDAEKYRQSIN